MNMMSDIDWYLVSELESKGILRVEDGNHGEYRPRNHEFCKDGVSFIRAADISDGQIKFLTAEKINTEAFKRIRKGIGAPNDILITHKGTVGRVGRVPADAPAFVCSPQTTFWRVLDEDVIDPNYLFALMRSPQFQRLFMTYGGETDMAPYVSLTSQRSLKIKIPELENQRSIGAIVNCLDNKIELNQKMNQTLEDIAKAIFKSWFVDFDPVRAKAEGRPTGLPPEISDLFPDELMDSKIGEIPRGWNCVPLDQIGNFRNGLALQKYPALDGEEKLPVVKIAQLRKGSTDGDDLFASGVPTDFVIKDGDYVFAWSGSLMAKYWVGGRGALNQHLFKVEEKTQPLWFIAGWVEHFMPEFQSIAESKATTMGHIKREHLKQAICVIPTQELVKRSAEVISPLIERSILSQQESRVISELRDTLLPKLISGELRIPDAEKFLEEAGI